MLEIYLGYQLVVLVGAAVQLLRRRQPLTAHRVAEVVLHWSLAVNVGVAGLLGAYAHTARAAETAALIGWAPGSPFQFEVAMANLAFGVLGVLCIRLRGLFWWATAIGYGVFLLGAAYGHIVEIVTVQNYAPGNAGIVLWWDILTPIAHLILLAIWQRSGGDCRENALATARA